MPTIQSKSTERFYSCQPTLRVPRKDPRDRIFQKDQLADFKKENLIGNIVDFKDKHIPIGFTVCRNDESIVFHKMQFDDMGFPKVSMAVRVDSELHVKLQLNGQVLLNNAFLQLQIRKLSKVMSVNALTDSIVSPKCVLFCEILVEYI